MKIPDIKTLNNIENITVNEIEIEDLQDYHWSFIQIDDEKKLIKYIRKMEQMVRSSFEYREYIAYLKDKVNLTQCHFFSGIDINNLYKTGIEFHHYPFNLFEITLTVMKKQTNDFSFPCNTYDVINEVTKIHYENIVGLIPLSKTIHELAHNGLVFININDIHGNINSFIEKYSDYISEDLMDKLKVLIDLSKDPSNDENKILDKSFQYIIDKERKIEEIALEVENIA